VSEDEQTEEQQLQEEQESQTRQIIETGSITTSKGRHTIHCLVIVGQIVMVDNDMELQHKSHDYHILNNTKNWMRVFASSFLFSYKTFRLTTPKTPTAHTRPRFVWG
jgi:tRNA G37 N-methylase Trm5